MRVKYGKNIQHIIDEQIRRWEMGKKERSEEKKFPGSVITLSREPGSGGDQLAEKLAQFFGYNLFHQQLVHKMAENSKIEEQLLQTIDERGVSVVEGWLKSFSNKAWPDEYLKQLIRVVGTIARHGRAVIVGRGANYIIPLELCFRVRLVAPLEIRIKNVMEEFEVSKEDAERRITRADSERKAFIRRYFYTDIGDPHNYDLVINTGRISLDNAVKIIDSSIKQLS